MRGVRGSTPGHGSSARYKAGCPCQPCRAVATRENVRYRMDVLRGVAKRVPGTGTTRRLQALAAVGWDAHDVALRMGRTHQWVSLLRRRDDRLVFATTADAVRAVYDILCMAPGKSTTARRLAAREGWPSPLAWDDIDDPNATPDLGASTDIGIDTVAVDRAIAGDAVTLTHAERVEAVRIAAAREHSDAEIAHRLRVNVRTVLRIRTRHNILSRWNETA